MIPKSGRRMRSIVVVGGIVIIVLLVSWLGGMRRGLGWMGLGLVSDVGKRLVVLKESRREM